MTAGLEARGVRVTHQARDRDCQAVLVIGGTRDLAGLRQARRRGIPIVQRLNGMNWLHWRTKTGLRHFVRAEYGNWLLDLIRTRLADRIVYQSEFARNWWERARGKAPAPSVVIYNGVDLAQYTPEGPHSRPADHYRLLLVEGSLQGGYEMGLKTAVELTQALASQLPRPPELMIVGKVAPALRAAWEAQAGCPIRWMGQVPGAQIPEIDRSAHLLYSADLNPACPNAVIEALACGLPVAAFDTGALPELVPPGAGRVVPYGGDPWRLDPPDVGALAQAALEIIRAGDEMRTAARHRAREAFGLEEMVEKYLQALLG